MSARRRAALRRSYGALAGTPETSRIAFGDVVIDLDLLQVFRAGRPVTLTTTEFRVLLLASAPAD